jgi:hypothetical protein
VGGSRIGLRGGRDAGSHRGRLLRLMSLPC